MLVKYWKNFKWFLFIPLIVFVFVFKISNVNAMVWKGTEFTAFDSGATFTGYINGFNSNANTKTLESVFVDAISTEGYDWLVFPFYEFNFTNEITGTISNLEDTDVYCDTYSIASNYYGNTGNYLYSSLTCTHTTETNELNSTSMTLTDGSLSISAQVFNENGNASLCYFNKTENQIYCPTKQLNNIKRLVLYIKALNTRGTYNITYYRLKQKYNDDATEITVQQQTTNTNLQYIYQYQQDDSTTGATTQVSGDFTQLAQDFNTQLSGVNDLTQLVLLPISLFMDLSTDNCQPLHLQIPYVNMSVDLPCMKAVFNQYFNGLYSIFTTIMSAVICYWVAIKTGALVKEIVDCDNDRIEVVDL